MPEESNSETPGQPASKVIQKVIEEEMQKNYLGYAMSVIVGRALPDVRDGLKPVHRRVLYSMWENGMLHNRPFKKSARIVGEVLGKYHPHGDMAVYDALVRMAQDFSMRYPLIDGQGNFGSVDGDNPAAMRYTECHLAKIAEELLVDIEKETVDFMPNFDGSLQEPMVLPGKLPNLLINGSAGIAVGMATNIPPHNILEVINATIALIQNPAITVEELLQFVQGPDFPTAGIIQGRQGILDAYKTGRGKIINVAKATVEEYKGRQRILVTEIPYMVNKSQLIEEIAALVREKKIPGIHDLRDESNREGMRIVIELKKDTDPNVVLNQLYTFTRMRNTFGIIMLALVENEPKVLNLKGMVEQHVLHRRIVVRRRTAFDLKKAEERDHILQGLLIALADIDAVVQKIKQSKDVAAAQQMLIADYALTEIQAKAILEMKLQRLASLEQQKIRDEHQELIKLIAMLKGILASEEKILAIIVQELEELKQKYGDERRTRIEEAAGTLQQEDLIAEQDMAVTITHAGYIKRLPVDTYRAQQRGGKGIIATGTREEDFVEHIFVASTHSSVLFFTDKGKIHWLKVYEIPEASRQSKGKAVANLMKLDAGEKIMAYVPVKQFDDQHYLILATKKGIIKKTNLTEYSNPRKTGIIAITLDEGDTVVNALLTDGKQQLILATKNGMAARFHEEDARSIGRTSRGVRGVTLREGDEIVDMVIADETKTLLTVTEHGYGKRSSIAEYRLISRGGIGVINIQCTDRNGKVVAVNTVSDDDEVMLISQKGIAIRMPVQGISVIGRNTQGVRLMKIEDGDKVMDMAKVVEG
ncbi:DNA gyrase subunit A [Candidatus Woesearchaeota archaeon]|nr:DNA gyrase subunit A [Candidatus Woesearchaeota archaeon]